MSLVDYESFSEEESVDNIESQTQSLSKKRTSEENSNLIRNKQSKVTNFESKDVNVNDKNLIEKETTQQQQQQEEEEEEEEEEQQLQQQPQQIHDGRIRNVPHIPGNWAIYVHVRIPISFDLKDMLSRIYSRMSPSVPSLRQLETIEKNVLHVSVSRTAFLKVFQIHRFVDILKKQLSIHKKFKMGFSSIDAYQNDEGTCGFLSLNIGRGYSSLLEFTRIVDNVMISFRQPVYYKDPSFHTSIAYTTKLGSITKAKVDEYQELFKNELSKFSFDIDSVYITSGNKDFRIALS